MSLREMSEAFTTLKEFELLGSINVADMAVYYGSSFDKAGYVVFTETYKDGKPVGRKCYIRLDLTPEQLTACLTLCIRGDDFPEAAALHEIAEPVQSPDILLRIIP